MHIEDLDYHLPQTLIATTPAPQRDAARLMAVDRTNASLAHRYVRDLPDLLQPGDLLVFNESKVIPAAFHGRRQATGGRVSGLYLHIEAAAPAHDDAARPLRWRVMLEAKGRLREGESLHITAVHDQADPGVTLTLIEAVGAGQWIVEVQADHHPLDAPSSDDAQHAEQLTWAILDRIGSPPLPPYIRKARRAMGLPPASEDDRQRYNTVYARTPGSVAAPTAGLHFTPELLARLDARGIERTTLQLHVGMGTFMPIRGDDVLAHTMHAESFIIPAATLASLARARDQGRRIIPVGTTSVRALESLPDNWRQLAQQESDFIDDTELYITPGRFTFRFTDGLMTNFHLPRSTLLLLVAALPGVGLDRLKQWYARAVADEYRFFSYGDAMLLL